MLGQRETIQEFHHRFPVLFYCILAGFFLLTTRLLWLQIYQGSSYREFSELNSLRKEKILAPRGQMVDRQGRVLVDSRLVLDVTITPQFVKDAKTVLAKLSELSGEPFERLHAVYQTELKKNPRFYPIPVIPNAPWSLVAKVESSKEGLSGVEVRERVARTYKHDQVGAQVFGYVNEVGKKDLDKPQKDGYVYEIGDYLGRSGLERKWESYLRGTDGYTFVEVDAHGHRVMRVGTEAQKKSLIPQERRYVPPSPGNRLVLTIDEDLQLAAAKAMEGKMGAVVVLDPRTGEILAMLSNPSFNPADGPAKGSEFWLSVMNNPYGPMRNKAVQDHWSPGSTFKVLTAISGLENGVIEPDTILSCPPTFRFGNRTYHEHNKGGFGRINVREAIRSSSDVFFWQVSLRLGIDKIAETAKSFGLGRKSGIELGEETSGLIPTEEWKQKALNQPWAAGETLSCAIGQGYVLTSPLQLANAYAVMVNGGNVYKPYLVSRIESPEGRVLKQFGPELRGKRPLSPEVLEIVKGGMFDVVNAQGGTARWSTYMKEELLSGKTGTTQVVSMTRDELFTRCDTMPFPRRHHAWFAGYAPRENPELAIAVFVMHGCGGSASAAPVAKAVVQKWWDNKKARENMLGPQPANPSAR